MDASAEPNKSDLDSDTSPGMVEYFIEETGKQMEADAAAEAKRLRRAQRESTSVAGLRRTIRNGTVLFYPACFVDWDILKDFSGPCRTFIYSDWHSTVEQVGQAMPQRLIENPALNALRFDWNGAVEIPPRRLVPGPLLVRPSFLRPDECEGYTINVQRFANKQPWCRHVPGTHTVGGQDRKLDLVYLSVEGVNAYRKLFNRQRTAPKYLCIKQCGDGFGFNYTAFYRWDQPLGRAVLAGWREHGHAPEFLIADREDHDWPWTEVVGRVAGATVYALPKGLTVQAAAQARRKAEAHGGSDIQPCCRGPDED
jgi:hypothetical protein